MSKKKSWDRQTIVRISGESMVSEQAITGWLNGTRQTRPATVKRIQQAMRKLKVK